MTQLRFLLCNMSLQICNLKIQCGLVNFIPFGAYNSNYISLVNIVRKLSTYDVLD